MNSKINTNHRVGLIFGKFYPLHCGHIYLIEKALTQVDELHVMIGCEKERDHNLFVNSKLPRQPQVYDRFYWLQQTFKNNHNVHIHILNEDGITSYPNGWQDWSDRVKKILAEHQVYPTTIFTSELQDVDNHQRYFNCEVKLVDVNRDFMPISATQIRNNPYQHWSFIAKAARPFFVKRVALIGQQGRFAELPEQLANIFNTEFVPNGYVNYINKVYNGADHANMMDETAYIKLAAIQVQRINEASILSNRILFTSLDIDTIYELYQHDFKKTSPILEKMQNEYPFDLVIKESDFSHEDSFVSVFESVIKQVEQLIS
ncbi:multifunctional transcriptional regulator/nicotinamide-nucleotide adenylyltransferase/ribosylnicotinamide kinase NadR [Orbaceae bacterium ac157xtp]